MRLHGSFDITIENNILISRFYGPWNYEQTKTYQLEVMEQAKSMSPNYWARIVDLSQWEGGGEEVVTPLVQLQQWALENNCLEIVFVNPPLLPKFMLEKYGDPYGDYKVVQTIEEAKAWLDIHVFKSKR
ncbi:hypothetical protein [Colwellia sp. RSH04]|uniref:hypothetical protein n=1 Tax=Colwellia sp. RSH04 TaxID=2305464 RepID=UPI000E58B68B|nr:hypothetical protein [Colwellia sp. RSH04]RHW74722.1 hypothetical protein D1094_17435 [Colwellia sp. RSH04]